MLTVTVPIQFNIEFDHSEGDGPQDESALTAAVKAAVASYLQDVLHDEGENVVDVISDHTGFLMTGMSWSVDDR